jgi:mono/diheme cytochrome c family protein
VLTPDELALAEEVAAGELERWTRERDERLLEAIDPGEKAEHTRRIRQDDIGRRGEGAPSVADVFLQGEAIFERDFTRKEGLGSGLVPGRAPPALSRVENRATLGGPDALSCRECHGRGGDDGHGELHQRAWLDGDGRHLGSAKPRVPPHVVGVGLVQLLAAEMTADLAAQVKTARALAEQDPSRASRVVLVSKGVGFGEATVRADRSIDTTKVRGVDADLIVKPFGWKGVHATLRSFARAALPQHVGLDFGGPLDDRDRDGVGGELHEGQLTSLVAYLALLDVPVVLPPRSPEAQRAWHRGAALLGSLGCAECHRPELPLASLRLVEDGLDLDLARDSQVRPRIEQFDYSRPVAVRLYSDLRRHDLGPALAERSEKGVAPSVFLTRPLWGLGDRGNYYLHDGRARTLRDAILAHDGEARSAKDAYAKIPVEDARAVEVFLLSLRRVPQGRFAP